MADLRALQSVCWSAGQHVAFLGLALRPFLRSHFRAEVCKQLKKILEKKKNLPISKILHFTKLFYYFLCQL